MAVVYVDLDNGNNTFDGLSFANRQRTVTQGLVTALASGEESEVRVMSNASKMLVGDSYWKPPINSRYIYRQISNTLGSGTVTINFTGGADYFQEGDYVHIVSSSTSTLNDGLRGYWKISNVTSTSFQITGTYRTTTSVTSLYAFKIDNQVVELTAPVTQDIAGYKVGHSTSSPNYEAWVASTGVTYNLSTGTNPFSHTHERSLYFSTTSTFNSAGKVAYYPLPSTLDLSAYQQLNFWMYAQNGNNTNTYQIHLCSDAAGDVPVNIFTIPGYNVSKFNKYTLDYGSSLGSNINSIAIYRTNATTVAQNLFMEHFFASKAPSAPGSLSLCDLIGTPDSEGRIRWYEIDYIYGTAIGVATQSNRDTQTTANGKTQMGHSEYLTAGTYPLYKVSIPNRQSYSTTSNSPMGTISTIAPEYARITVSGGWDPADMATVTGETYFGTWSSQGSGLYVTGRGLNFKNFVFSNLTNGLYFSSYSNRVENCQVIGADYPLYFSSTSNYNYLIKDCCFTNYYYHHAYAGNGVSNITFENLRIAGGNCSRGTTSSGILISRSNKVRFYGLEVTNSPGAGFRSIDSNDIEIYNFRFIGIHQDYNSSAANYVFFADTGGGVEYADVGIASCNTGYQGFSSKVYGSKPSVFRNYRIYYDGTTPYNLTSQNSAGDAYYGALTSPVGATLTLADHPEEGTNWIINKQSTITNNTSIKSSDDSNFSWELTPRDYNMVDENQPIKLRLGEVGVSSGGLVSIAASMRRSSEGILGYLSYTASHPYTGLTTITSPVDTWQRVEVSFSPPKTEVITIDAACYTNTATNGQSLYVDNLEVTQTAPPEGQTYAVTNFDASYYLVNGVDNPNLNLRKGATYTFNMNSSGHPFHIQTTSGGYSAGDAYTSGVTVSGDRETGVITFVVPYDAPSTLYYVCQYHSSMGGAISITL